jgi:hypothetical protein
MPDHSAKPVDDGYCIYCDRNYGERHRSDCTLAFAPVVEPHLPTELPSMSVGSKPQQSLTNEQAFDLGREKERQRMVAIIERLGDGYANQHGKEREVIDDVLHEIKERR